MININLLHEDAITPSRGSIESAGLDLHTIESVTIPPGQRALLRTGFAMSMPVGYVGLIWPRSKLAAKKGVVVLAGVVDSDYIGEIHIALLNTGFDSIEIKKGDKCAQLIVQKHSLDMEITIVDELAPTCRGRKGINCTEIRM